MFKTLKINILFLFTFVFGSITLLAQEEQVSDKQLHQFAEAFTEVQLQNQKSQQEMIAVIEDEGLEVVRFNEIQKAVMNPNETSDATAVEKEKHENVTIKLEKMQPEIERKTIARLESTGISLKDYESLAVKIQENQSLQQRLKTILMKRQDQDH
ncbi:DUF4168 domain-containing protein [Mariniflexile ostreae]|uniref:DUF4168 domain-containing protein n=1 Tax=Mariniflexile ostreae TaxID=1520892 RepID=A0ABV5F9Y3_9FLAO